MKREESLEVFVEVQGILREVHEVECGGKVGEVLSEVAVATVVTPEREVSERSRLEGGRMSPGCWVRAECGQRERLKVWSGESEIAFEGLG